MSCIRVDDERIRYYELERSITNLVDQNPHMEEMSPYDVEDLVSREIRAISNVDSFDYLYARY